MTIFHYNDTPLPVGVAVNMNGSDESYELGLYDGALYAEQWTDSPEEGVLFQSPGAAKRWLEAVTTILAPYIESGDRAARVPRALRPRPRQPRPARRPLPDRLRGRRLKGLRMTDPVAPPPLPKYRLELVIEGNSHDEIANELLSMTRGGYLLATDYYKRDECHAVSGRRTAKLTHQNPDMTPERYDAELTEWFDARKAARRAGGEGR